MIAKTFPLKTGITPSLFVYNNYPYGINWISELCYSRPRACSKNYISMINGFTLANINTKIIKAKWSKIFISVVCLKLVAHRIQRYTKSSPQFQEGWWPGSSPAGRPVVPGPPFEIGASHFTFGSPVAAYIQYCILKMCPPFWFLAPHFVFWPPCC